MIKKDYILRLIEQLVRLLVRVVGLKDLGQYTEALRLLRDETRRLIGLDGALLEVLEPEAIGRALHEPERIAVAGRILEEEASIYRQMGEPTRATATAMKALELYVRAYERDHEALEGEFFDRARALAEMLHERARAWDDRRRLFRFHEALGLYAKAEDVLFELIESGVDTEHLIEEGCAFYMRLLGKSDGELAAGGLPREEVEDGLAALEAMRRR